MHAVYVYVRIIYKYIQTCVCVCIYSIYIHIYTHCTGNRRSCANRWLHSSHKVRYSKNFNLFRTVGFCMLLAAASRLCCDCSVVFGSVNGFMTSSVSGAPHPPRWATYGSSTMRDLGLDEPCKIYIPLNIEPMPFCLQGVAEPLIGRWTILPGIGQGDVSIMPMYWFSGCATCRSSDNGGWGSDHVCMCLCLSFHSLVSTTLGPEGSISVWNNQSVLWEAWSDHEPSRRKVLDGMSIFAHTLLSN